VPTTTVYLPNITKTLGGPSGWYTPFIVQNIDTSPATLEVSFYRFADGSLVVCRKIAGLAPGTSFADVPNEDVDLPNDSQFAVVVRSFGAQVVSVVNEHQGSGERAESGSYVGLTDGATKVYLPWVIKEIAGTYSTFIMQNLGSGQAAVNISFTAYESSGPFTQATPSATLSRSIAPGRSAFVDPRIESALPAGTEYAVTLTSNQPIGVVVNVHRDAAAEPRPRMFSYNGVGEPKSTSYLPYLPRTFEGRTAILLVQNAGTTPATPTVTFHSLASGVASVTVEAPAPIAPGAAWFMSLGIEGRGSPSTLSETTVLPCSRIPGFGCVPDGEWSAVISDGEFAVLAAAKGTTSIFGYTAVPTGTRSYLPNVTRTLGGTDGWTTPVVVQSAGASSATVRWYRFADGQIVQTQFIPALGAGRSVKIDPRNVPGLVESTQYAVVVESSGSVAALVTEYNFQGGDGAMVYEGFARGIPPAATPSPVPTPTPTPIPNADLVITTVFYDGVVSAQEPDEYLEFRNNGSAAVSLGGWTIRSVRGGQSFAFLPWWSIQAGQTCRLYTNEYHAEWCGMSWNRATPQWNNSGDRANLVDFNDRVVSTFGWNGY
jgi:lamin tail-like protein